MKWIGIYEWPVSDMAREYRGLYRGNNVIYLENKALRDAFFRIAADGNSAKYSEDNLAIMKMVSHAMIDRGPLYDLIMFSEDYQKMSSQWTLIGFDICSNSHYYSPIGAGLLERIEKEARKGYLYDNSRSCFKLNNAGLFSSYHDAKSFSYICNALQNKNQFFIESETNWHPWYIWVLCDKTNY